MLTEIFSNKISVLVQENGEIIVGLEVKANVDPEIMQCRSRNLFIQALVFGVGFSNNMLAPFDGLD